MSDAGLPASSYIDIAPNEYVTKYSINRNFEKLLSNDFYLYEKYSTNTDSAMSPTEKLKKAQTYNKLKTYNAGDFVFYKIKKDDTKFYILSSAQGPNSHKPTVRKNVVTNDLYVVNSDWWVIVGIDPAKGNSLPKDQADMHVNDSLASFQANHERNTEELSAHPVQRLGMQQSEKTFRTLENVSEDRQKFQYPSYLQSLVGDSTVYQGYMRKWDNGLLEYDLTFRLGYISSDAAGKDLISANNLVVPHRNKNYLYFKDDPDYATFNKGGDGYVVTPSSKQVNLNPYMNAYTGTIKFPEPFRDLDYMVFTTNVKNIETEAYSLKSEAIAEHDKRLVIEGRRITGVAPSAVFLEPCSIPDQVANIAYEALANVTQVDGFPVVFKLDPWKSELINIEAAAFNGAEMSEISVPASVRYIGQGAFSNCQYLSCVDFFVYADEPERQARIDKDAFPRSVKKIRIHERLSKMAAFAAQASHEQVFLGKKSLYDRLTDADSINYKAYIGLDPTDNMVSIERAGASAQSLQPVAFSATAPAVVDVSVSSTAEDNAATNMYTIDVKSFLAELPAMRAKAAKKMAFAAAKPPVDLESVFHVNAENHITGFNSNGLPNRIGFDLNDMPDGRKPICIESGALSGFNQLTSLTINPELTDIQKFSLPTSLVGLSIQTAAGKSYSIQLEYSDDYIDEDGNTIPNSGKLNVDSISVDFSEQPMEFELCCGSINELHTAGSIPKDAFYAQQIDRLYVENPVVINESAFYNVIDIGKCSILSHTDDDGTTIKQHAFRYVSSDGANDAQTIDFNELTLVGKNWHLSSGALEGVTTTALSIDMTRSQFAANAWTDGGVSQLYIKNIGNAISSEYGEPAFTLSGFMANSLSNVEIWTLTFTDIELTNLTADCFPANVLTTIGLSTVDGMYIQGSDGKKFFKNETYVDNDINSDYFNFTTENWISSVNSLKFNNIKPIEMLIIPYGTAGICADVLNMSKITNNHVKNALSAVNTIYIPNTVNAIGASAFYMLSTVKDIVFDNGIDLTAIGENAFGGMPMLSSFTVP